MRSQRSILSLKWTPANAKGGVRRAVGGFLRYVQYRDHHEEEGRPKDVEGMLRYVAYRDSASPEGRLFTATDQAGDRERLQLGDYIARSVADLEQPDRPSRRQHRACYRFVLSPEDARGLDLRLVTRQAMAQLETDIGAKLPPWLAAEHRNTAHPHTHIVLAARREVSPGHFRSILITRRRLERIKVAMRQEIARQRGERVASREQMLAALDHTRSRRHARPSLAVALRRFTGRVARGYLRQAEQIARQRDRERELEWSR
ncbi:MAG TPA: hypothetical protein VNG93_04445 [Candidatus Dormibacteraeota bacterium]|nr:hypothetical protein [Candidatus Dormibacteraeota bacterium]